MCTEKALFVQSTAEHYGITFHLREWHAKPLQVGMHSATRTWRRRECMKLIGWNEAGWDHAGRKDGDELCARDVVDHSLEPRSFVCTAHQVEDQVETFMLKLLRGAHISRLNMVNRNITLKVPMNLLMIQTFSAELDESQGWPVLKTSLDHIQRPASTIYAFNGALLERRCFQRREKISEKPH